MAKKSTASKADAKPGKSAKRKSAAKPQRAMVRRSGSGRRKSDSEWNVGDILIKLIESPLVADLLAVGATAAVAAITETRSGRRDDPTYKSSRAVKAAAKAAAAAMGRRLSTEVDEIRRIAKETSAKRGS